MKKIISLFIVLCISIASFAAQYTVKYKIKGNASTTHATTTLELKNGTESEAKAELVRKGTVSKKNADNIIIVEVKKK
ncbi:hypothetical protein LJC21_02800 [Bacteroides sp. OttesenSCG-928-E20]|nr:hypothetical protein [Bacteroides sp. OttesenSCG-928-N06]MDL2299618.1 hypothetical protein [Bacteroides sp. OttesenSCG-928-E20]